MRDGLLGHHLAHIGSPRGVADHRGSAADQNDRTVARHLKTAHEAQRHEMPDVKAIRRRVKADIEDRLAAVDHFLDLVFIGDLRDQTARHQLLVNRHFHFLA